MGRVAGEEIEEALREFGHQVAGAGHGDLFVQIRKIMECGLEWWLLKMAFDIGGRKFQVRS